jgi:hypothetical protein
MPLKLQFASGSSLLFHAEWSDAILLCELRERCVLAALLLPEDAVADWNAGKVFDTVTYLRELRPADAVLVRPRT